MLHLDGLGDIPVWLAPILGAAVFLFGLVAALALKVQPIIAVLQFFRPILRRLRNRLFHRFPVHEHEKAPDPSERPIVGGHARVKDTEVAIAGRDYRKVIHNKYGLTYRELRALTPLIRSGEIAKPAQSRRTRKSPSTSATKREESRSPVSTAELSESTALETGEGQNSVIPDDVAKPITAETASAELQEDVPSTDAKSGEPNWQCEPEGQESTEQQDTITGGAIVKSPDMGPSASNHNENGVANPPSSDSLAQVEHQPKIAYSEDTPPDLIVAEESFDTTTVEVDTKVEDTNARQREPMASNEEPGVELGISASNDQVEPPMFTPDISSGAVTGEMPVGFLPFSTASTEDDSVAFGAGEEEVRPSVSISVPQVDDTGESEDPINQILGNFTLKEIGGILMKRRISVDIKQTDISYDRGWVDALERGEWRRPDYELDPLLIDRLQRYLYIVGWNVDRLHDYLKILRPGNSAEEST